MANIVRATTASTAGVDGRVTALESNQDWRSLSSFGAKGDCVIVNAGGAVNSGQTSFVHSVASFTSADVGKSIFIRGAGASGGVLSTTIAAVAGLTTITLAAAAGTTVSNARYYYGTDDTAAVQAAFDSGAGIVGPTGSYLTGSLALPTRLHFRGMGPGATRFIVKPGASTAHMRLTTNTAELLDCSHFSINGMKSFQTSPSAHGIEIVTDPNGTNQAAASMYLSNDPAHVLSHIMIHDTKGDGYRTGGRGASRTSHFRIYNCDGHGAYIDNYDSYFDNIEVGGAGLHGVWLTGNAANHRITNLKVFYSGNVDRTTYGDGLYVQGSHNQFGTVEVQNAGRYGVHLINCNQNLFAALYIEFPSAVVGSLAQTTMPGLRLDDTTSCEIRTVITDRNTPSHLQYGIELNKTTTGCFNNQIIGNITNTVSGVVNRSGGQGFSSNAILLNGNTWFYSDLSLQFLRSFIDDAAANAASVSTASVYVTPTGMLRWKTAATASADVFTAGIRLGSTTGPVVLNGNGAPAVAAPIGSLYVRSDGGTGTTLYVKESGTDATGWVAK